MHPSVRPSIHPGAAVARRTRGVRFKELLQVEVSRKSARPPPQNPLSSSVSLAVRKNTGPVLLWDMKAAAPRGEDLHAGRVPLSG